MFLHSTNRKISVILLLFAVFYLYLSYQLPEFPYAIVDSDVLPKGLGFLLIVLSIALFIENKPETEAEKEKRNLKKEELTILLTILGMILLYIWLLEWVGFVLTTIAFLLVTTRLLGYQNWKVNSLLAVLFTFTVYFSFNYLLSIYLPQGILPF
ncbi:tripartite tricarboxylate transporter TctB family protein [Aeribacillus pallidus]|uniref:tripartite tricarboxylate transporter TctB family protein n=1 Tax=Aeribacillus pallidus TaxID=33936 RepID=UPI003D195DCF